MTERSEFENPEISHPSLSATDLQKILRLQSQILEQAVVRDDQSRLLDELCLLAESFTPNSAASIMLYDREQGVLNVENGPSLSAEAIEAFNGLHAGDGSCGNAVYHTEAMYVCNTLEDPRWSNIVDVARRFNICSCFSFPILDSRKQSIGSFAISSFEFRRPEGFHRALLETCTSICGVILQRRADDELRREMLEEQLKTQRLSSLGILAGGIAHDFNNLLATIMGNVDLAALNPGDRNAQQSLELAMKAVDRAGELTQQLLTFSRGGMPVKIPKDIRSIVQDSSEFALHGSNVGYEISGFEECGSMVMNVDEGQIGQLIQNLMINARQSMPDGGLVRIACTIVDHTDRCALAEGNYLKIEVSDTGKGIPEDILEFVFDPYYTTREDGTGLGLFLCYSIASNHDGGIFVDSRMDVGTCFTVYLPHNTNLKLEAPVPVTMQHEIPGGRVVIMDDDAMIRKVLTRILEHLGFEVCQAADGSQVLDIFQQSSREGQSIDLTILDLTIPGGMGGIETRNQLHALDPNAVIVVSSGYSAGQTLLDYETIGFAGAIAKPYRIADVKRVISEIMRKKTVPSPLRKSG